MTKKDSAALKGVAILMMLWHHNFLPGRYEQYFIRFWPFDAFQVVQLAIFFKICVSLFAFISGYGLYCSWQKRDEGLSGGAWTASRLVSTLSTYWFVVVLSWIVCAVLDGRTLTFYAGHGKVFGLWHMALDFFGLSHFFGVELFNVTWWYMSAAIAFVLLAPVLASAARRWGGFVMAALVLLAVRLASGGVCPGNTSPFSFVGAFALGMAFAQGDVFTRFRARIRGWRAVGAFLIGTAAVYALFLLNWQLPEETWWDVKYALIPAAVILYLQAFILPLPVVRPVLCFLGKHATNIFLVHTFIRYYYFADLTYRFGRWSFAATIVFLLAASIALSYGILLLKKLLRYDALIERLQRRIRSDRLQAA